MGGGGLERAKGGLRGGYSVIKVRNFSLPHFGIMFEGGTRKNMNDIRLGSGNFFASKPVSFTAPLPSDLNNDWPLSS